MGLDIRTPMGLMFTILGAILTVYGLVSDKSIYASHSLGININLYWGVVVLIFGVVMLLLSLHGKSKSENKK